MLRLAQLRRSVPFALRSVAACAALIVSVGVNNFAQAQTTVEPPSPNRYLPGAEGVPRRYVLPRENEGVGGLLDLIRGRNGNGEVEPRINLDPGPVFTEDVRGYDDLLDWTPQLMPDGLVYRSYLAGVKEPRMASTFDYDSQQGWLWDITLGGRVGVFRFGTEDPVRPEGFEIDLEGAAMPRLDLDRDRDLLAVDFRAGVPITYGIGPWSTKVAFYHLSSHVGDEFLARNPGFTRINYSRNVFVFGQSYYVHHDVRVYGEVGYATYTDVAEPWEFQFGLDYSPLATTGIFASPFLAINTQLRQEVNFGGNVVVQAGWQWRPQENGKLLRIGVQYYNGKSNQFSFYNENENKVGAGIWYDY